ncbi:S8 family serine peptidase [Kribbella sp. NPDC050281]|uniref:S8 family serine peptidase n=1 Tax=Kribbella sp. NPDC050281 TaxID=3155515 RepID=UPI0033F82E8A
MHPVVSGSGRRRTVLGVVLAVLAGLLMLPAGTAASAAPPPPAPWQDKVSSSLRSGLVAGRTSDFMVRFADRADLSKAATIKDWNERGEYVVQQLQQAAASGQRDARAALDAAGNDYTPFWITDAILVKGGSAALAQSLAARPEVVGLQEAPAYDLTEPAPSAEPKAATAAAVEWGLADIQADKVWSELDDRGQGIVVGSIDTGVQFDHPALVNSYRGTLSPGVFDHDYNWFDPSQICPSAAPCDNIWHGTHTMGTMVGGDGPRGKIGVAPDARWIAAKGCEDEERGCSLGALLASGQWMLAPTDLSGANPRADLRPNVLNNSWGDDNRAVEDPFYDDVVAAWNASGIFAVFSNGNDGRAGCDTTASPADGGSTYAVGGYDEAGAIGDFSGRGPGVSGRVKPDIAAPGVAVGSSVPGGAFGTGTGTSMASPHVSGTVALMWSAAPSLIGDIDGTRELLNQTAVDTGDLSCGGTVQRNNTFGEGRLNALAAVEASPRGDTGTLAGRITDNAGKPVADATVVATAAEYERRTTTAADGTFEVRVRAGTYDLAVSAFGFENATADDVVVTKDQRTVRDATLTQVPMATVRGKVTDGSGHGWPLYAALTVAGTPLAPIYTSPVDGSYRIQLPVGSTYRIELDPDAAGYQAMTRKVLVQGDQSVDFAVPVIAAPCTAPGYHSEHQGLAESFDGTSIPAGWTQETVIGDGWEFDDPGQNTNLTGGSGGFASIDSGSGKRLEDSRLISPSVDLSSQDQPVIAFRTDVLGTRAAVEVDLSVDDGATWTNVWHQNGSLRGPRPVQVPVPTAAGHDKVQARFRYSTEVSGNGWLQIDDVVIGTTRCAPVAGGLVLGNVTDDRFGRAVDDATVRNLSRPADVATAGPTPADPSLGDGFYWMFAPIGRQRFSAQYDAGQYEARTRTVDVRPDTVVRADFALGMAELKVTTKDLTQSVRIGDRRTIELTVKNVGTGRATYELTPFEDKPETKAAAVSTVAERRYLSLDDGGPLQATSQAAASRTTGAKIAPWQQETNLPEGDFDALATYHDGKLYKVGGVADLNHTEQRNYVYDLKTKTWQEIARTTDALERPAGGFVGDNLYVVGGWPRGGAPASRLTVYDPATDKWLSGPDAPIGTAAAASAVLGGKLYVIGGRTNADDAHGSRGVMVYDPVSKGWTRAADYPEPVSWQHCGAIGERIYCAGGDNGGVDHALRTAYSYNPVTNRWLRLSDLPATVWGAAYSAANGELLLSGGMVSGYRSNLGFAYSPASDSWRSLPNSQFAVTRVAGACGFFKVGGAEGILGAKPYVEQLTGNDQCAPGGRDVPWLRADKPAGTLTPGQSTRIRVTLDARTPATSQPREVSARLLLMEDTPFRNAPLTVTMDAVAPPDWGQITGTVTGKDRCTGQTSALPGAALTIGTGHDAVHLVADEDGRYSYWLKADGHVQVSAAAPGWLPAAGVVKVRPQQTTTGDLLLAKAGPCSVQPGG